MKLRLFAPCMLGTVLLAAGAFAQANIEPSAATAQAAGQAPAPANYTQDQLMTATVHQAWVLSGKNESNFFDMVQKLAAISAANRGITLPDSEAAGRRMGQYIKRTAKMDTDQLLYAVVDKAVVMTTHAAPHPAGSAKTTPAAPPQ